MFSYLGNYLKNKIKYLKNNNLYFQLKISINNILPGKYSFPFDICALILASSCIRIMVSPPLPNTTPAKLLGINIFK